MDKTNVCKMCGNTYILGTNGTTEGCDGCAHIERDIFGNWWRPGDDEIYFEDADGNTRILTREEAFDERQNETEIRLAKAILRRFYGRSNSGMDYCVFCGYPMRYTRDIEPYEVIDVDHFDHCEVLIANKVINS